MKQIIICLSSCVLFVSCYKNRSCDCTYSYTVSGKVEQTTSPLSGKMTKKQARKECNALDGTYTVGANLEEMKADCNLSE